MTKTEQLDLMYNLEIAINELTKATKEWSTELVKQGDHDKWYNAEIAYQMAKSLTATKLAIGRLLDGTHD